MDRLRLRARTLRNHATDAERALWRALRGKQLDGFRFRRQVPIGGYIADFACPQAKLIVEIDGGQHALQAEYDAARTRKLEALGYRVLRYWNGDVLLRLESVVDDIHRHLVMASITGKGTLPRSSVSLREREDADGNDEGKGNE
ncbi:endonuclease domain-containing protein [Lysobacter yangpyeongensis]|uniref:Endonuclease domain-containing protein n=1 Tax=Lysobacter yangpyeongensis TaxID=346182 RepID=A0ABW0SPS7_9GAMM